MQHISPSNMLDKFIELYHTLRVHLEGPPCRADDTYKSLIVGGRNIVKFHIYALDKHLLALLQQRLQYGRGSEVGLVEQLLSCHLILWVVRGRLSR